VTTLNILAVDDEPLALLRLEQVLARIPGIKLVGSATGCAEAIQMVRTLRPDVLLLDITMRDGSGFDLINRLPAEHACTVIFVTAFDYFAVRAFETSAVDYVLKPVSVARMREAIERARNRINMSDAVGQMVELRAIVEGLRAKLREERTGARGAEFWIRGGGGGLVRVLPEDIEWIQSEEDYVRLHTRGGSFLMRGSIRGLSLKLDADKFVRVHRNALVRRSAIRIIHRRPVGGLVVELQSGARVAAGRVYAKHLRTAMLATG
jgi:two-component system LytT family response regulator